ncbi:MAG: tyrosine--tRNA ligase [Candidatus Levybacteria bacterium]|nr:tyrosine--tRNA ligase [Candidatus Levybacteria bacterium]
MDTIDELLTRGVANIIPSKELLVKELSSGKKLNIYLGIDPTAINIHLGHALALRKLQQFADLGHNVTFLVGDFTALIGDTSDKESERPQLTSEQIQENLKTYKEQASKVLDFSKITIKFNSEWLSELKFADIVKLTQHFTLGDFISRELIKKRLNSGGKIGLHEVLYPVMQGYDSYHLDTDVQLGGTDQTFNMQAGRTLVKDLRNKESFIVTNVFLSGTDGRKMSKTWGNAIWLTDNHDEMFGKIMSLKDELIVEYFTLATDINNDEIAKIEERLKSGENPMDIKKQLATIIVEKYHGAEKAKEAEEGFRSVVQNKEVPKDIESINITTGIPFSKILIEKGIVNSISEWKRLIEQHGVTVDDKKIENPFINTTDLPDGGIIKIGKRKYVKIVKS